MIIGVVHCECYLYNTHSLKEKRSVIKSIMTRLKQTLNVAVAEVDYQELWQRTTISIVTINNNRIIAEKELQKALALIDRTAEMERMTTEYEWL
ncbi:DUF503 domain-containing protein [Aliibacillus thermotolerans]|uniref:DUF503 domain-containing protein n=1 Tax=Aliibacillus thermotolerans TaxID=1834418 RepID=A0ABW0U3T2_9BACI|nr:DUF503 family protein [Aliibacillus thermotolerans]MDA3130572.1 DUF503 family protein [Aliibacillus thermotolerans]